MDYNFWGSVLVLGTTALVGYHMAAGNEEQRINIIYGPSKGDPKLKHEDPEVRYRAGIEYIGDLNKLHIFTPSALASRRKAIQRITEHINSAKKLRPVA